MLPVQKRDAQHKFFQHKGALGGLFFTSTGADAPAAQHR